MITLGSTDSINAGAQAAATVNYVIEGELVTTTTTPPSIQAFATLAKGQLTASVAPLFTPGANTEALISRIVFFNTSPTSAQVVTIAEGGTAAANTVATLSLPASGFAQYEPQSGWTVYAATGLPLGGGSGGGGGVTSVNARTGAVSLTAADVANGALGTSGQFLQTDGAGHGSWQTVTGGTGTSGVSSVNTRTGAVTLTAKDITGGTNGLLGQFVTSDGAGNGSWTTPPAYVPNPNAVFLAPLGGGADDTPQIRNAINSAVAQAISNGTNYAEIWLQPGVYQIKSATIKGGATLGNAQIPLPVIDPTTHQKMVLAIKSYSDGSALPMWNQPGGQKSGACLYTSGITGTNDPTYGQASVLGGPTPQQNYGNSTGTGPQYLYSNMVIQLDGISVVSAVTNPTMCAFDFRGLAAMNIGTAGAFCDASTATVSGVVPTNNWVWGLWGPNQGNNDELLVHSWSCEGYYKGLMVTEHYVVDRVCCVYCVEGIELLQQTFAHANFIAYASIEHCIHSVVWSTSNTCTIMVLDIEDGGSGGGDNFYPTDHLSDGGFAYAQGYVGFSGYSGAGVGQGTAPIVNGCQQLQIENIGRWRRIEDHTDTAALNVPASGTTFKNPIWRDCMVVINATGSSMTDVKIGPWAPRSIGLPSPITSCTVLVPSGFNIQLTYTGTAPTWQWIES